MKRSLIVVLIIGLLLFSVACGGSSTPAPEETATQKPVTQPATGSLKIKVSNQSP